jgi:error-prone DNA polymerase
MFITVEDKTELAHLIVRPSLLDRQRRVVLSAGLLACRGRVQREGEVIHLIAEHLIDLSNLLRTVGERNELVLLPLGRKPWDI